MRAPGSQKDWRQTPAQTHAKNSMATTVPHLLPFKPGVFLRKIGDYTDPSAVRQVFQSNRLTIFARLTEREQQDAG
jgi:hypothetical protein